MEVRFHPACEPHGPSDQPRWMWRFYRAALARDIPDTATAVMRVIVKWGSTLSIVRVAFPLRHPRPCGTSRSASPQRGGTDQRLDHRRDLRLVILTGPGTDRSFHLVTDLPEV